MNAGLRRAINRSRLWIRKPDPRHIVALTYALTYRCNGRCRHCGIWQHALSDTNGAARELTTSEVEAIWTDNVEYFTQLQSVHFTGGEPFLRHDFSELCNRSLERFPNARVHVSTNGLDGDLVVRTLTAIGDLERVSLSVSLDGLRDTYQAIRGVDGSADVQETLQRVRRTFPDVALGINVTIVRENASHLQELYAFATRLGADFGMQVAHKSAYYHNVDDDLSLRPDQLHQIAQTAEAIVREYRTNRGLLKSLVDVEPYYFARLADIADSTAPRSMRERCFSGTHSLFLDPYGNVYPCLMSSTPMGRLPQQALRDFWHSAPAIRARHGIAQGACRCWTSCEVFPSLARDVSLVFWNLKTLGRR